jgi:intracellular septation protein
MNPQIRRILVDFAPLVLFFAAYKIGGIYAATVTVIAAAVAAVGIGFWLDRKIPPVPLFTAVVVSVLGGLTLYLRDDTFIKMKPTFVYACLGLCLVGGELAGRPVIKYILGTAIMLKERAWRGLAFRFGGFFFVMAGLNELVWRLFSRDFWVNYHVFGAIALTVLFGLGQTPYLLKNQIEGDASLRD